ncbi:MAG: hypothetical protein WCR97_01205 [Bacilli bacterium]
MIILISTGATLGIILGCFALIALLVLLARKLLHLSKKEKPDEKKVAEENLNRYLEDVDDKETQKQFDEFEKKKEEEENTKNNEKKD